MFRGQMYDRILVNGEKTSLTTAMGPDWESWFAIRELYCNAVDEGGAKLEVTKDIKAVSGKTQVYVELTNNLAKFFRKIKNYILVNKDDLLDSIKSNYGYVETYPAADNEFICYRKGIRIYPANQEKSLYRYNFSEIEINESRTYKYDHEIGERIASYFAMTESHIAIQNYLAGWKSHYEKNAKWEYASDKLSKAWHEIMQGKRVYPEALALETGDFEGKLNSYVLPNELAKKIHREIEGCEVVGMAGKKVFLELEPTPEEAQKIKSAVDELRQIGYDITCQIKLAKCVVGDVIAWYDRDTNIIYHTRNHLTTIPEIKTTLLEEHFHSLGLVDGQRSFVEFLLKEIIKAKSISL